MNLNKLKKLSGDASIRSFYRKKNYKNSSILVYCKKQKESNLLIYAAINNLLIKQNILAPRLINHKYNNNYIEIEDFGNQTVFKQIRKKNVNKLNYYKKILLLLKNIQKIKTKKIKTFLNTKYKIPDYSKKKLIDEANLFLEWYLPKFIKGEKKKLEKKKLLKIFKKILNKLTYKNQVFVHRDFHVSNVMVTKKGFGLIDSQDAVFGNVAYDLASLIDDVRLKTNNSLKNQIFNEFIKKNKSLDKFKFKNDLEILSVLRNFKIIGIFSRLSKRDKKHKYLKLIPYAWNLIEYRINGNKNFKDLKIFIDNHFPTKVRSYEN